MFKLFLMRLTNNGVAVYYRQAGSDQIFRAELCDGWERESDPAFVAAVNASGLTATQWD